MEKSVIEFALYDQFCDRVVKFSTSIDGDHIGAHIDAFKAFLASVGFAEKTIHDYFCQE